MASDREKMIEIINLADDRQPARDLFDLAFAGHVDADYGPGTHWTALAPFQTDFGTFHSFFQCHLVNDDDAYRAR